MVAPSVVTTADAGPANAAAATNAAAVVIAARVLRRLRAPSVVLLITG
jgi:hypothetical protein